MQNEKKVIVKIGFDNNKNNNILLGLNEFIRNLLTHKPAHCTQRYKNVIHTLHTASGVIEIFIVDINLSKSKLKTHTILYTRHHNSICIYIYIYYDKRMCIYVQTPYVTRLYILYMGKKERKTHTHGLSSCSPYRQLYLYINF